jgi:peptidyl-prolyl cis-trans isomerase SurA
MHKYVNFTVILFLLILILCPPAGAAVLLDRVVAVVNKDVITWSELYKMMEYESTEQMKALSEEDRMRVFKNNESLFLDKLIDMRLQLQEAKRTGLDVSPEEVKEAIENIKQKYSLTDKSLEENLAKEGLDIGNYKKSMSEQILVNQFLNKQVRSKIVVSDDEIKSQIDTYKTNLINDESFKIRQIFLKKPKDDAERKAAEEKASLILQRLKSGEDFSKLAQETSEDPSGKQGGDLGYVKKNLLAKEFTEAFSKMKIGDISLPFWTEKGLHIVKLEDKTSPQSTEDIKENMRKQLTEQQFMEKYKSLIKDLREKAHIEIRL